MGIENILKEELPPETYAEFQSWHKNYKKNPRYESNDFAFLKSIRRFFMRQFESPPHEISFLETGLTIFEVLLEQNATDKDYILIHTAYLYEHLGLSEKADESIKMALHLSTMNTPVIVEKVGDFYRHLAEAQLKNPVERAQDIFQSLAEKEDYRRLIDEQLNSIKRILLCGQIETITGNDAKHFTQEVLTNPEILSSLQTIIDQMKQLVEAKQITVDVKYVNEVIRESMANASKGFRERDDIKLSNECALLRTKCSEILAIYRGDDDSRNFTNYYDMANELNAAKEQNLHLCDNAKRYYENYETYIEKAISMGETRVNNPDIYKGQRLFTSLADAYRLRGNLRRTKGLSEREDYRRGIELYRTLGDVIYNDKGHLDRNVERLAECYFSLGEYESAIKEYEILFKESNAKKYQAAIGLGKTFAALGDFLSAKAWYLECLKISKDDPPAYDGLVYLHRNYGYYDDAIEWEQKMMELEIIKLSNKALDFSYFQLGTLYEEKGDTERAAEIFKHILTERQPDSFKAFNHLISILIFAEKSEEAIKWLKQYEEYIENITTPGHLLINNYCQLGDWYLSLADKSKAFEYYNKILTINTESLPGLQRLAKWHDLCNEYGKAIEIANKIIRIVGEEESYGYYKWIGDLYCKLKDKDNALAAYDKSLEIKPNQPDIFARIEKITEKRVDSLRRNKKIRQFEMEYQNSPSPELAAKIVNYSLDCYDKEYAGKALELLNHSIYKEGTFDYYDKLASIRKIQQDYESVIDIRSQIDKLASLEPQVRLTNLKVIAEIISENRLYRHKSLESKCVKKIEDFIRKNTSTIDEGLTTETETETEYIEQNIYTFRDEIAFLAEYYLKCGYYTKAHHYIGKLIESNRYGLHSDKVYLQIEAEVFFAEGRFDDAKRVAHTIVNIEGEDSHALFLLGKIYRRKKEYPDAIKQFQKSYYASSGRIDALDQMGATYREWAIERTLTESEKAEIKQKALDCYNSILKLKPNDTRARYGLAKSYLLGPLDATNISQAVEILTAILKSTIKDIDRKAIIELLSLWRDYHNDTIKRLISGTHELTSGLNDYDRRLLIREIIVITKDENFFEQDVVDTLKKVFKENPDKYIREAICKFLMKYLIYKSQQQISLPEVQELIKEIVGLILETGQYDAIRYLAEYLGSEKVLI